MDIPFVERGDIWIYVCSAAGSNYSDMSESAEDANCHFKK